LHSAVYSFIFVFYFNRMTDNYRYTLIGLGLAFIVFLLWFFSSIVIYIIIAAVLALVGNPIVDFLGKLRIRKLQIPVSVRALIALLCLYGLFIGFFWIFIPIVANEANELSSINVDTMIVQLQEPLDRLQVFYDKYQVQDNGQPSFQEIIREKITNVLNVSILTNMVSSLAETLGNLFIAIFSITFITFFFLREEGMLA